jgi:hypothetical protein
LVEGQLFHPARKAFLSVEVNFAYVLGEEMGVALQLQGRAAADDNRKTHQGLEGYDDLFPPERAARRAVGPPENAMGWLLEPTALEILGAQGAGIAMLTEPLGCNEEPLGHLLLH